MVWTGTSRSLRPRRTCSTGIWAFSASGTLVLGIRYRAFSFIAAVLYRRAMATLSDQGFSISATCGSNTAWPGRARIEAPTLIMLHEGLGSAGMWGDFPTSSRRPPVAACSFVRASATARPARRSCRARSTSCMSRRIKILPRLLDVIGFRPDVLVGHSDGASIAAIYAGSVQDHRMRGLVLMAPHFIVEDVTIGSIAESVTFDTTDLRQRFGRCHADLDATVHGWTDVWLKNDFHAWDLTDDSPISAYRSYHPGRAGSLRHRAADRDRAARSAIARSRCCCCRASSTCRIARRRRRRLTAHRGVQHIACCASTKARKPPRGAEPCNWSLSTDGLACTIVHEL